MRKLGFFLALVSVLLLALPVMAQEEPGTIGQVWFVKRKAGMEQQYEAAWKRHIAWHRQQNDTWTIYTWQIVTGERLGTYVVGTFGHRWEDFDARAEFEAADEADFSANVAQYVESASGIILSGLPKLSRPPEAEGAFPINVVYDIHLKMGMEAEYTNAVRKVRQAIEKTNWPVHYWFEQLVSGGEHPTYFLVMPYENWAGLAPPEKSFTAMLEEAYGRPEADSIVKTFNKAVHCERSEIHRYRPDLSYVPVGP